MLELHILLQLAPLILRETLRLFSLEEFGDSLSRALKRTKRHHTARIRGCNKVNNLLICEGCHLSVYLFRGVGTVSRLVLNVRGDYNNHIVTLPQEDARDDDMTDRQRWVEELAALQESFATGEHNLSIEVILSEDRENRL